jgi:hypothetical protein
VRKIGKKMTKKRNKDIFESTLIWCKQSTLYRQELSWLCHMKPVITGVIQGYKGVTDGSETGKGDRSVRGDAR